MAAYFQSCEWLRVGCDGAHFCLKLLFCYNLCPRQSYRDLMARHRCSQNSLINEVKLAFILWIVGKCPTPLLLNFLYPPWLFFLQAWLLGWDLVLLLRSQSDNLVLARQVILSSSIMNIFVNLNIYLLCHVISFKQKSGSFILLSEWYCL